MEDHNGNGANTFSYASTIDVDELERQVERGSLFTQATFQRGFTRIQNTEALLTAVIRALVARGVVSEEDLGVRLEDDPVEEEEEEPPPLELESRDVPPAASQPTSITWPGIAIRMDDPDAKDEPEVEVDCAARMHICKAICCSLKFPLNAEEIDAGKVKWDIGHPYVIRHDSAGMCVHNDSSTGFCSVYADRPKVCRGYTCVRDTRIWKDFDNMVLNQEWIDEHLGNRKIHVRAVMPVMAPTETWSPGDVASADVENGEP
jgi:Fe-S-cluster containining protein